MSKLIHQTDLDRRFAPVMFYVTLGWLAIAGVGMHLMQDEEGRYLHAAQTCGAILIGLWVLYLAEAALHFRDRGRTRGLDIAICLFPPLRLGGRDHLDGTTVWIPRLGWRNAGDELAMEIEMRLGYTMIAIALLILPLLCFEHFYETKIREVHAAGLAVQFAQGFIWFAFAAEFLLAITLVTKRFKFVKEHWLDLAIILLPMIAFLRAFRVTGSVARITKSARVFRLRGLAMRAWRAILILQIIDRVIHRDQTKRLLMLEEQIAAKRLELEDLEAEAQQLRASIEAEQVKHLAATEAESV